MNIKLDAAVTERGHASYKYSNCCRGQQMQLLVFSDTRLGIHLIKFFDMFANGGGG